MKKSLLPILLSLALSGQARASDDIKVSNLFDDSTTGSYWNVASSEGRQSMFNSLSRDLGIAISHKQIAPGETLGLYGFEISLDTTVAFLPVVPRCPADAGVATCQKEDDRKDAWRVMDADHRLTFGNALVMPTVRMRKGLPFSTEVGVDLTYIAFTHQTAFSGYGRVAVHEGMWERTWRVIPDVAFTVAGTRFLGNDELDLSVIEWNGTLGWTFPVGGVRDSYVGSFSPFVGAGMMYITSSPRDPLPEKLDGLNGQTGLRSRESLSDEAGARPVVYDPSFRPWKFNVGVRIASGDFRFVSQVEFARNNLSDDQKEQLASNESGAFHRPTVSVGVGFVY